MKQSKRLDGKADNRLAQGKAKDADKLPAGGGAKGVMQSQPPGKTHVPSMSTKTVSDKDVHRPMKDVSKSEMGKPKHF